LFFVNHVLPLPYLFGGKCGFYGNTGYVAQLAGHGTDLISAPFDNQGNYAHLGFVPGNAHAADNNVPVIAYDRVYPVGNLFRIVNYNADHPYAFAHTISLRKIKSLLLRRAKEGLNTSWYISLSFAQALPLLADYV